MRGAPIFPLVHGSRDDSAPATVHPFSPSIAMPRRPSYETEGCHRRAASADLQGEPLTRCAQEKMDLEKLNFPNVDLVVRWVSQTKIRFGRHSHTAGPAQPSHCPSPCDKLARRANFRFAETPNQWPISGHPVPARGAVARRHERGMGCGGRESVGAQLMSQGGLNPVSDSRARRTNDVFSVRQNRVVLTPVAGAKSAVATLKPYRG